MSHKSPTIVGAHVVTMPKAKLVRKVATAGTHICAGSEWKGSIIDGPRKRNLREGRAEKVRWSDKARASRQSK